MIEPAATGDEAGPTIEFEAERVSFEALYADQFLPMVRLATLMCGRVEVARDIVQDAFVRLHVKWAGVDQPQAYLRRSVVNGCRSRARWERLRRGRVSSNVPTTQQQPEELNDVLALLSARQRAAIVLRFYEQRNEAEIAELIGCRPGTVGSLISRGLATMKHHLDAPGAGRSAPTDGSEPRHGS
ncbi:MAG: sigma-70 family RNA polymerase sigma factor [Ilumatobacter sp.]|nr:sigma-70 family RNA polymerase sigma factor [Ilumatobacter sp.]